MLRTWLLLRGFAVPGDDVRVHELHDLAAEADGTHLWLPFPRARLVAHYGRHLRPGAILGLRLELELMVRGGGLIEALRSRHELRWVVG